jgi:hypothetical protein
LDHECHELANYTNKEEKVCNHSAAQPKPKEEEKKKKKKEKSGSRIKKNTDLVKEEEITTEIQDFERE